MKASVPEALARERDWWWRCLSFCDFDQENFITRQNGNPYVRMWKGGEESAAWAYELIRRSDSGKRHLPQWYDLPRLYRNILEHHLAFSKEQITWIQTATTESRWREFTDDVPLIRWNLFAKDDDLKSAFWKMIECKRTARKISKAELRAARPANRSFSWRWPEVLDIFDHGYKEPHDDCDDSTKRQALKRAQRYLPAFEQAWKEAEKREAKGEFFPEGV